MDWNIKQVLSIAESLNIDIFELDKKDKKTQKY